MTILQQPDALSFSMNLKPFKISTSVDVEFSLSQGGETLLTEILSPNADGLIELSLRDIIHDRLSCNVPPSSDPYQQTSVAADFTAVIGSTPVTFRVIRGGVDRLADTVPNFVRANFLTWQPNVKPVTYSSPEFLSYYAVDSGCTLKVKAYFTDASGNVTPGAEKTVCSLSQGVVTTVSVQYAVIAGLYSGNLPAYYDVWVASGSTALTYTQRYYASAMRSEEEQWVFFENSLGGIDTFRAFGAVNLDSSHDHHIAEIDDVSYEYRVDTERKWTVNTGHIDILERRWLLDFFPSAGKYIYAGSAVRRIVLTDDSVAYRFSESPSSYSFTFRFAESLPLLNLPRHELPVQMLDITVPEVGSFSLPPRLLEFTRLPLSEGVLFPVQSPYSEEWQVATLGGIVNFLHQFGWVDIDQLSSALADAITNLRQYMEQAFRTGVISQSQSQAIEKYINVIRTTMAQAAQDYQSVYGNRIFETTDDEDLLVARDLLTDAYTAYTEAATALLNLIAYVIADHEITQQEVDAINTQYEDYNAAYSAYCAALSNVQNMLIGSTAASIEALNNRFLRKANTNDTDPEGDTETLPITFEPKQIFKQGFVTINEYVPGITGRGSDLTVNNVMEEEHVMSTNDLFTTDFILARKRVQTHLGLMEEAEFGTFINGGSGFVSSFVSNDGLTAVGRGAKIYASGAIESGTVDSRGNLVARGVSYTDGGDTVYLANTGEVIGYNALQAGRIYTPGAAGSGIRFNSSGYGELSQLALRQHLVNSGVFADGFFGEGFKIWNDDGTWKMTIDQLTVRQIMNVYELLVNRIRAVGGMLVVSPASGKIKSVTSEGDYYKIRFESGNDSFAVGDLVRMQRFTGEDYKHDGVGQVVTGYWVEVVDTRWERVTSHNAAGILEQTEQVIWIRKDDIGLWDMPAAGDEVVQLGNTVNPARQSLIALTANESTVSDGNGGQVGTPTIDILTGVNRRNFSGTNRTRLGYLGDIVDSAFYNITTGVVESPQGYGLYSDNAYLKGRFVLADGSDVYTMFTVQSGRFESAIGNISSTVMTDRENYLSDVSFANRLANWVTNKESVYFQQPLQTWILANGGVLSFNPHKVSVQSHGGISTVDLGNGSLTQRNAVMSRTPYVMEVNRTTQQLLTVERARVVTDLITGQENYQTDNSGNLIYDTYVVMQDGSEILQSTYAASPGSYSPCFTTEYVYDQSGHILKDKSATPVWLTFMIAVETAGMLTIGFDNEVTDGFSSFAPFSVREQLSPTGDDGKGGLRYVEKSFTGYWSGSGDFTIAYTGKCSIYGLRLWSDMELQYATKIRQTNEYIRLEAEARNAMGDAYKSMLEVTARQIQSIVSTSDGRISTVKQTADGVSAEVADARGNNASLKLRIDGISSDVSTISGQVSSLQQTATSLSGYVGSFAPGSTLASALAATQSAAEATAAADATSKMNSAIGTAAADANTKMSSAISTAASDALSKANAAEGNAKNYADDLDAATRLFVTSGFVAQSDFATMYAHAVSEDNSIVKTANMGVYVTWDASTHQISSGAVINADQINFIGKSVTVTNSSTGVNTLAIDSSGNVSIAGTVDASGGYIGGIQIHSGSLGTKTYNTTNAKSMMYIDAHEMGVYGIGGSVRLYGEANNKITVSNLTSGASAIDASSITSGRAISAHGEVYIDGDLNVTGNINYSGGGSGSSTVTNYGEATSSSYGLIMIGYTQSGKNYPVQLSGGKAYVNVPWTDNNTTYTNGNGLSLSGTTFSLSSSFTVSGNITAADFILSSDERRKFVLDDIKLDIDQIADAPSKLFTFKDDREHQLQGGTLAQYWEDIAPWAVTPDDDGYLGVSYAQLGLVSAIACARETRNLRHELARLRAERGLA